VIVATIEKIGSMEVKVRAAHALGGAASETTA